MMAKAVSSQILQLIRRVVEDPRVRELADQELLQQFHAQQNEGTFHALLRRHGPMVLDVCRAVLGNEADAEDAFQATFLILARKAGSIRKAASLGCWLHGVAYRTALKARAQSATRQKHEARVPARQASEPDLSWQEVRQVLHEELSGVPERYRAPLLLCYLEGATQEAAAVQLRLAKSTLRERLQRGRALLRTRLMRRGLGPAALLVAAAWPAAKACATVPMSMMASTVKAATAVAAGGTAVSIVSAKVVTLTEGALRTMILTKLKIATAVLCLAALACYGLGMLTHAGTAEGQSEAAKKAKPKTAPAWKERATIPYEGAFYVFSIALSPDGKTLATGINHFDPAKSGEVVLWDTVTGEVQRVLEGHTELVTSLAFSPDGKTLASASHDKTVKLWDIAIGKELRSFEVTNEAGANSCVIFSPDGKTLAVAYAKGPGDEGIKLLNVDSGKEAASFPGFQATFSPDAKTLATGTLDGVLKLWDVATGAERTSRQAHDGPVTYLAFSPDGKTLATVSNGDDTVKLWDVATANERALLKQATQSVQTLAFFPDGKSLAAPSCKRDGEKVTGMVMLWDVATGQKQATVPVGNGPVTAVALASKNSTLAAASFSTFQERNFNDFSKGRTKVILKVWELK
jgi:RNA polymerase sigma factor (sigma-70 family)